MKVTVYYSADASKCTELDVQPTDTVKAVKQRIISLYPPPDWSNAALLAPKGTTAYLENRRRLRDCSVADGTSLKFAYARNLTPQEKVTLNFNGIETEEFTVPAADYKGLPLAPVPA
uniref:Ubiquitin-like domain-containing protein n=1 Tax=Alexandrium andersonii TaxID=327968 RepID=A0A7S2IE62_9DINO|mmetsp:Transcript_82187/g.183595  ORF Transcript_82187/g.183595 Transcript_82187/m.183595 type:complete len:117 (+) Transcript_82187:70-420(+)